MKILAALSNEELEEFIVSNGYSKFHAKQIHNWIFNKFANSFDEMTDLSKKLKETLKNSTVISDTKIKTRQISTDGTIKYLLEYPDGNCVETVLMRFDNRANLTACVSSQVGCAVGCNFCATGKRGFIRNLTAYEIIDQVLTIQRDIKLKVTNIVFMGQGEPLLNLENVLKAINIFHEYFQIGMRRMTVSTSGIVPKINELRELNPQFTLAVSLHAPTHSKRMEIMPIENKYTFDELLKSLKSFVKKTGNRVTIEYILIKDFNDKEEDAKELISQIKDLKCNINLIPYNPISTDKYQRPTQTALIKFKYILEKYNKKVTIRLERGADIDAACGQLSGKIKDFGKSSQTSSG